MKINNIDIKEYRRNYYKNHRDKLLSYVKNYNKTYKVKLSPKRKLRFEKFSKDWHEKNKEYVKNYSMKRRNTPKGKFAMYKSKAKVKHQSFLLTLEEFDGIIRQPCFYCNDVPNLFNGIDRVDSKKGYEKDNSVACCWMCNRMKSAYSKEEFIGKCEKIVENLLLKEVS